MSDSERALRDLICELGRRLYAKDYVAATDGNLSVRLGEGRYLVTPSGVSKGFMAPEHLLIADGEGRLLHGEGKVTSEFFTHLAAYEEREDVLAVIHAHPPMCTAVTLAGIDMRVPLLPEVVAAVGGVPTCPYATPGTREGADAVRAAIRTADAVLLDRHGSLTVGKTLMDMEAGDYSDSVTQQQSKFLMRHLLAHHLGGVTLNTRQILIDLLQL